MSKLYTEEQVRQAIELSRETHQEGKPYLERDEYDYYVDEVINKLTPIQLPSEEERDKKFMDFLQTELELGISDKATIERIEWYYDTYFTIDKIKGGQGE